MHDLVRAKVAHFTDQHMPVRGIVHIGANDGEEIPWYMHMGHWPILAFEPHPVPFALLRDAYEPEGVQCVQLALGSYPGELVLHVPDVAGTKGSSKFMPIDTPEHPWTKENTFTEVTVPIMRFDDWADENNWDPSDSNCLVVDVQGMELDVLIGMGDYLGGFGFLNIECSQVPVYDGEAPALEVIDYLWSTFKFHQDSPTTSHDDIMFVREN